MTARKPVATARKLRTAMTDAGAHHQPMDDRVGSGFQPCARLTLQTNAHQTRASMTSGWLRNPRGLALRP